MNKRQDPKPPLVNQANQDLAWQRSAKIEPKAQSKFVREDSFNAHKNNRETSNIYESNTQLKVLSFFQNSTEDSGVSNSKTNSFKIAKDKLHVPLKFNSMFKPEKNYYVKNHI